MNNEKPRQYAIDWGNAGKEMYVRELDETEAPPEIWEVHVIEANAETLHASELAQALREIVYFGASEERLKKAQELLAKVRAGGGE